MPGSELVSQRYRQNFQRLFDLDEQKLVVGF